MKVKQYKKFQIHYVTGNNKVAPRWKYDIYHEGLYFNSVNSLKQAREFIKSVIWTKENIPL